MTTMRLAVITGSVREGRHGPTITRWFEEQARRHGLFEVDVLDAAGHALPAALPAAPAALLDTGSRPPELRELSARLAGADAFAVVTPEYNHSYPASLKHLIDWHVTEWQAKPVALVSYGGMGGGVRAAEHLRQVFAELHAVTIRQTITFDQHWLRFDAEGRLLEPEGPEGAAKVLLDQLGWWSRVLRDARLTTPYVA
ncbi:NADPH-dependent FMN reductase [Nonomuraea sp. NPDC050783]|uniref:NADPH-dependent FMN reductase n=1 Tax=Nonomuraea sp. NPDC050783 TaxID=3154634 RepID=UPI0034650252